VTETPGAEFVTIARIRRAWGRRGEAAAELLTDFLDRFQPGAELTLLVGGARRQMSLESVWYHKGQAILKFRGLDTISAVETLAGAEIQIPPESRKPLAPGEFFLSDLVGCAVLENGQPLGTVEAVEETGATPLLQVLAEGGEILIPFAEEFCRSVDLAGKQIHVRLPAGLIELNRRDEGSVSKERSRRAHR